MEKYLINTTVTIYLIDIAEINIVANFYTINDVIEEASNLRNVKIDIRLMESNNVDLTETPLLKYLSETDLKLLQTAKSHDMVLVTDDKKLAKVAKINNVRIIDTPRLISTMAFNGSVQYNTAREMLKRLDIIYNRKQIVKKTLQDLEEWR